MSISFDSTFPGGNGLLAGARETDDEVEVDFAAEPKRCPQPLWFHFRLSGLHGRSVTATLLNAGQCLGGPNKWGANRVVHRANRGDWNRAGPCRIGTEEAGCLQASFSIPGGGDEVEVAFCYPYQPEDLQDALAVAPKLHRALLGYSISSRPMERWATCVGEGRDVAGVYVLARQHSGETPGSWVMDGMLRALANMPDALDEASWWFVPFVNIDGVREGSYGKNPYPADCNRAWAPPPDRAEIRAIRQDIDRWRKLARPKLLLDLHAPAHQERSIYFYAPTPQESRDCTDDARRLHDAFLGKLPAHLLGGERTWLPFEGRHDVRARLANEGTNASHFGCGIEGCMGLTLEVTYQGIGDHACTIEDYRQVGRSLVEAVLAWLR